MLSRTYLHKIGSSTSTQQGLVLIAMASILIIILTATSLQFFNRANLKSLKVQKTQQALALAKQALLAYAAEEITVTSSNPPALRCIDKNNYGLISTLDKPYLPDHCNCGLDCPRPGDLPCPDRDNDGEAEGNCSANQSNLLGRLPWKTLGIDDIRDGAGERLWYAVSNNYKNNPRILPLNSDTLGTISLKNAHGQLTYDAATGAGLVAMIIAPNDVLLRADELQQNRETNNSNDAKHYLDIAFGEDNANFAENTSNGFISGIVKSNDHIVVNDVMMMITRNEMNAVIEPRVLAEAMQAVLYGYCPNQVAIKTRACSAPTSVDFFPDPALSSDITCLSNASIANSACRSHATATLGRIPVGGNANWDSKDVNSILRGQAEHNWFQQNGWRELIFYARAPACIEAKKNCTGNGFLTLNKAITPTLLPQDNNKKVVLIAAGAALASQTRADNANKIIISHYLEDENISPLHTVFSRYRQDASKNDKILSIP